MGFRMNTEFLILDIVRNKMGIKSVGCILCFIDILWHRLVKNKMH